MNERLREFLHDESAGGVAVLAATVAALVWANALDGYEAFWARRRGRWTCTRGSATR